MSNDVPCSVEGCKQRAIVSVVGRMDGYRCRDCLETDLSTGAL